MSKSEAGKLGSQKSKITNQLKLQKRIDTYNLSPFSCKECHIHFSYNDRKKSFCNNSCSAIYSNKTRNNTSRIKQRNSIRKRYGSKNLTNLDIYREKCSFKFNKEEYSKVPGYDLLLDYGMYDTKKNPTGVDRDHIFSKSQGFKQNIPPEIISHPANCQFLHHIDNTRKQTRCDISLEELMDKIKNWK